MNKYETKYGLDYIVCIGSSGKLYTRGSLLLFKKSYLVNMALFWGCDPTELKTGFKSKNDIINMIIVAKKIQSELSK